MPPRPVRDIVNPMNANILALAALFLLASTTAVDAVGAEPAAEDPPAQAPPCHLVEVYLDPPDVKVDPACPPSLA